jgi:hypothetical protein
MCDARWLRRLISPSLEDVYRPTRATDGAPTENREWLDPSAAAFRVRATNLACIAHKSLEICERCRLWQRDSLATPENSAAFWREE